MLYQDETLWLTQDAIAVLFDKGRSTITEHLKNIFQSQELYEDSVCRKFRRTASDEQAKDYAETEFEKYRIIQDRLFQSDFDKFNADDTLDFVDDNKQ